MRVSGALLWLGYTIILARSLTKPDFVIALFVINFALIAVLVITLGRDVALLRLASQLWGTGNKAMIRALLGRSRRLLVATGAVLTVALVVGAFAGVQTPVTQTPLLALLAGLITLAAAQMGLNRECLRAVGCVWQSQLGLNFTRSVVPIVGSGLVVLAGQMTVEVALTLFLLSLLLSILIEEAFLRRIDWTTAPDAIAVDSVDLHRTGLALWPGDMANAVQMRAAGLVAGLILAPDAAALVLAAERIAALAQFPIAAAAQAAAPQIARAAVAGQGSLQSAVTQASRLMTIGAISGTAGAAVVAWPALWALGPDYVAALPITIVLIGGHLSWAVFGPAQSTLNLTGHSQIYSRISVAAAIFGTLTIIGGTFWWGGIGAALGFCAVWWATNAAYGYAVHRVTETRTGLLSFAKKRH